MAKKVIFHIDINNAFLSWTAVKLLNEGYEIDDYIGKSGIEYVLEKYLKLPNIISLTIDDVNAEGGKIYIIHMSKTDHTILIPPEIKKVNNKSKDFTNKIFKLDTPEIEEILNNERN